MEPVTAGIFLINGIVNGLVNIFNGHKQRSAQDSLSKETMEIQRENMLMQLEQQRRLHRENNQAAIANQHRTFALTNTWPLNTAPDHIAKCLRNWKCTPLCFIVAPMASSNISSKLQSTLKRLKTKILEEFQPNSDAPVIQYEYKLNFPVNPANDISSIYDGIKCIPTLYIAPCLMDNDRTLSITIASWGLGGIHAPVVKTIEIDIRKLYVDQLRDDAMDYKTKCDKGYLSWDDKLPSANNYEIFENENLNLGFDWLDNQGFYNKLQACSNTLEKIGDRLLPFMTVFSVVLIDMYNVLMRSTTPRFPKYLNQCKHVLPDLRIKQLNSTVNTIKKEEYVESLCCTYVEYIANYADVAFCEKLIPFIKGIGEKYETQMKSVVCRRIENSHGRNNEEFNRHAPNETSFDKAKKYIKQERYEAAIPFLEDAALNNVEALYILGVCYLKGYGVALMKERAVEIFDEASKKGSEKAFMQLFYIYRDSDYEKALRYLNKAVEMKCPTAMYLMGCEVEKIGDLKSAKTFYQHAASLGEPNALKKQKGIH